MDDRSESVLKKVRDNRVDTRLKSCDDFRVDPRVYIRLPVINLDALDNLLAVFNITLARYILKRC